MPEKNKGGRPKGALSALPSTILRTRVPLWAAAHAQARADAKGVPLGSHVAELIIQDAILDGVIPPPKPPPLPKPLKPKKKLGRPKKSC